MRPRFMSPKVGFEKRRVNFDLLISARIQPTLHTSIAFEYSWNESITSGARYHLVATYSVMNPFPPFGPLSGGGRAALRARPKSQILRSQLALRSRLEGFKSRCRTFAECNAFNPRMVSGQPCQLVTNLVEEVLAVVV